MKTFVFAAALTALSACAAMEEGPDPAAGIAASSTAFEATFNSGDAAGLAALYTADAALLPPDMAQIDGREGIQALWQSFMDAASASWARRARRCRNSATFTDPPIPAQGPFEGHVARARRVVW